MEETLAALLAATAQGDRAAFARLYQATSAKLFGVTVRILMRRSLAEDVLQEVYVRIWDRASDYRPDKGAPMTWMITIARNRAIDALRRDRPTMPIDSPAFEEPADPERSPFDWALAGEEARRLRGCLDLLEADHRRLILLAYCEGHTQEDLARRTGRPLGTVKSWLRRGLARLRDCLTP